MKTITNYVTFAGKAFARPEDALLSEHGDAAASIHEIIKGATVKDYFVPYAYTVELVLAFAPVPRQTSNGIRPEDAKACRKKIEDTIEILAKYSSSLSDYLKIKEEE